MAMGGSFAALVLSYTGYVANTELNEASQTAIVWLFNLVPAGFSFACMIALLFYKVDSARFTQILSDLDARAHGKS
jgi:Na+/melibiose symporter-like transporter